MFSHIVIQRLRTPTEAQIEEAVSVSLRAFEGDISLKRMSGGNPENGRVYLEAMLKAGALEGRIYVATDDESGKFRAVALLFPPGRRMFQSDAQRKYWNTFWDLLDSETQEWWNQFREKMTQVENEVFEPNGILNSWWINIMVTDPIYQRKGFGSALISNICDIASKQEPQRDIGLATQSTENSQWYQSLCFKERKWVEIPAKPFGDHFPCYMLSRTC
ncbi:hypothetical protein IW261DRAFT_167942 [Armillaria novae-zelandiae]|uniref:N-acetyltransferase domain-containing protein n=1 Tax=Armillaria novae-zelandiae TaxID=153914 RepID=A0AA39P7W4_9AGAR|nr:hypothetical protein IW261DRAFT_167942 [Armillaria novae-zelandiae]